jgi:hypothetical protein
MPINNGQQPRSHDGDSLPREHPAHQTLTMTKNGSELASRSRADRANARGPQASSFPQGANPKRARGTFIHGVFRMHVHIDLKICESCGSLWYRNVGEVQVYCNCCAAKLGEFPVPRIRPRPGGRRKRPIDAVKLIDIPVGGRQ